mmetsp:Transcript_28624/g.69346  ORF Transcript_28624/g.69346 Transcript_28624/m.69346 type:complete len:127 (-) Transcript_28624:187-567(-)
MLPQAEALFCEVCNTALSFHAQCVRIIGPFKGGVGDNTILKESGILEELKKAGKICSVTQRRAFEETLSFPDLVDSKELHAFKTQARLRQETFNARVKYFDSLRGSFPYGFDKHKIVLTAVAVTVQ